MTENLGDKSIEIVEEILRDPHLFEGGHIKRAAIRILKALADAPLPPPQARTPRMDERVEGWLRDYSMFRPDKWDEIKAYLLEFENLGAESAPQEAGTLWRSVKADPPNERGFYLVWPGRKLGHVEVMYRNLHGDWIGPDDVYNGQTHWQNLPKSPSGAECGVPLEETKK